MKRSLIVLGLIFHALICFSQSQSAMNIAADKEYQKVDRQLNTVYQQILKLYKDDAEFIKNFKASQRIWIQFRDAEMKMKFPDREHGYYGSVHPMCWSMHLAFLVNQRLATLKEWVDGIEEGDVCAGSVRTKPSK
jgi:uncharacterized protein YecT (DUF1311 family)